jgi:hypothetical protein
MVDAGANRVRLIMDESLVILGDLGNRIMKCLNKFQALAYIAEVYC